MYTHGYIHLLFAQTFASRPLKPSLYTSYTYIYILALAPACLWRRRVPCWTRARRGVDLNRRTPLPTPRQTVPAVSVKPQFWRSKYDKTTGENRGDFEVRVDLSDFWRIAWWIDVNIENCRTLWDEKSGAASPHTRVCRLARAIRSVTAGARGPGRLLTFSCQTREPVLR